MLLMGLPCYKIDLRGLRVIRDKENHRAYFRLLRLMNYKYTTLNIANIDICVRNILHCDVFARTVK